MDTPTIEYEGNISLGFRFSLIDRTRLLQVDSPYRFFILRVLQAQLEYTIGLLQPMLIVRPVVL